MSNSNFENLERNSKDWTLKDDIELKNTLQEYSNNLIKTTKELNDGTKNLNDSVCKIDIRLANINNKLNYTKMKRFVEEKVDDISVDSLLQKNQRIVNEKKNQTKEEFEQHTIRTISTSVIKAFQKMSGTSIPSSQGIFASDPLDPCSSSLLNNSGLANIEIENPFVKMCKLPPIIGSKESFNYFKNGVTLKENTQNIISCVEKSSRQVSSFKDEDIQSTSSGRSIPPQDPTAGLNQNKTFIDQMVVKMAEKRKEIGIEQGNNDNFSQKLSLENSGKTSNASPSLSSISYETSTNSQPIEEQKSKNIIYSMNEKTFDNASINSSKQPEIVKNCNKILPKDRDDGLFSSTENDDHEDNISVLSTKTKKSFQQTVQTILKDAKINNVSNSAFLKTNDDKITSMPYLAHSNNQSLKQQQPSTDKSSTFVNVPVSVKSSIEECNKGKEFLNESADNYTVSKNDEIFGPVNVKGLIAQIGNKIPLHRPNEINNKEIEKQNRSNEEEGKPSILTEQLEVLKGRAKGPSARRIPTNLSSKLQKNNLAVFPNSNEKFNKEEDKRKVEVLKEVSKPIKEIEIPKQQKMLLNDNQTIRSSLISNNKTSTPKTKKGLSIFSSSSDDDFDLNINKKSIQEKKEKQQQQVNLSNSKIEDIGEKKTKNLEKQRKPEISKQRKGLFDDSDSDF